MEKFQRIIQCGGLMILLLGINASVFSEETFNPIGKTEDEIVKSWGKPNGKMDLGSEQHWMYPQGHLTFEEGVVIRFKPTVGKAVHAPASKEPVSATKSPSSSQSSGGDGARLLLNRLEDDLKAKQDELTEKLNSPRLKEIEAKYQEDVERLNRNYSQISSANYSIRSKNIQKDRDDAIRDYQYSAGIDRLKEEIEKLKAEIHDQSKKTYP